VSAAAAGTVRVRPVTRDDASLLHALVRELAEYENLLDRFECPEAELERELFGTGLLDAAIAECSVDGPNGGEWTVAGFALWYYTYSTFRGRRGVYLEDLFVRPAFRGRGCGSALLSRVSERAKETGCHRVDWSVLSWNESAKAFYRSLGAAPVAEWEWWRLSMDTSS